MKIAICDDNITELRIMNEIIREFIEIHHADHEICLHTFSCGSDLLDAISNKADYDLLILDIVMPGLNGIDLAKEIRTMTQNCRIVFLTSSPEYAVSSYKVKAYNYLLKPVNKEELLGVLREVLFIFDCESISKSIVIKEKQTLRRISLNTIEYIESDKHTLRFHLKGGETAVCYAKMEDFKHILLADDRFMQCYQSYIVNMKEIAKIYKTDFILSDQTCIPISRSFYNYAKQRYIDFYFEKGTAVHYDCLSPC